MTSAEGINLSNLDLHVETEPKVRLELGTQHWLFKVVTGTMVRNLDESSGGL